MAKADSVPMWLASLMTVVAIILAAVFSIFVFFHVEAGAVSEEIDRLENVEIPALRRERAAIETQNLAIEARIVERRGRLAAIQQGDDDARTNIDGSLPAQRNHLASSETAANTQITVLRRELAAATQAREDLAREEEQLLALSRESEKSISDLRRQIEERQMERASMLRSHRDRILEAQAEVREREDRVSELEDQRSRERGELISDGQILQARAAEGFVIIDRGLDHDLRVGTRFQVFNRRGGRNLIKGEIEVMRVEQRMSVCRVLTETDGRDPIIPGDHLHNRLYKPGEQKTYVIAGDFAQFSRPELARFIADAGGRVDRELSTRTHFLVAGSNADRVLEQAKLLGVTVLSENQLLDFVRRDERLTLRRGMRVFVAGTFASLSGSATAEFVTASGGRIVNSLDDGVDVLIAGEGADDAVSRAKLLGISVIFERQLLALMRAGAQTR